MEKDRGFSSLSSLGSPRLNPFTVWQNIIKTLFYVCCFVQCTVDNAGSPSKFKATSLPCWERSCLSFYSLVFSQKEKYQLRFYRGALRVFSTGKSQAILQGISIVMIKFLSWSLAEGETKPLQIYTVRTWRDLPWTHRYIHQAGGPLSRGNDIDTFPGWMEPPLCRLEPWIPQMSEREPELPVLSVPIILIYSNHSSS